MKISNYANFNSDVKSNSQNFTSRSLALRQADDVCRRVMQEFPTVYSTTKLNRFSVLDKTRKYVNFQNFIGRIVGKYHINYTNVDGLDAQLQKEISGMKQYKVGNCAELADAANIALRLNGYKDVKILNLFAYNRSTKKMRDLDHTVAGIDFKLPEKYEYCKYLLFSKNIEPKYRIYPQKDSIIVDPWAGFCEYGKNATEKYNSRRDLIKGLKTYPRYVLEGETLLKPDEELCFIPVYEDNYVKQELLPSYGKEYYGLILPKNRNNVDLDKAKPLIPFDGLSKCDVESYKIKFGLKSAMNLDDFHEMTQARINEIKEKYGVNSDMTEKRSIFSKIGSFLHSIF